MGLARANMHITPTFISTNLKYGWTRHADTYLWVEKTVLTSYILSKTKTISFASSSHNYSF